MGARPDLGHSSRTQVEDVRKQSSETCIWT